MNIYHVKRLDYVDYDEYSSAIVYAKSPKDAKKQIKWSNSPTTSSKLVKGKWIKRVGKQGDNLDIIYLGKAKRGAKPSVILNDYNAS